VSSCAAVSISTGWCVLLVGVDGSGLQAVYALEDELADQISSIGGEVDGHFVGDDGVEVFVYGSDVGALRQVLEDALRSSPFARWEISPAGLEDDDEDDPTETSLPAVQVWKVTAPPSWSSDSWIEMRSVQDGTVDGSRILGMFEALKRRDGFEPQPGTGSLSPVFALSEPLQRIDGSFDPWLVRGPRGSFESLSLPPWLLTAPSTFQVPAAAARRAMWSHSVAAELRSRRQVRDIVGRAGAHLDEVARADVTGVVWWWDDDRSSASTPFAHGSELVGLLTSGQPADDGRDHLIEGLRDAEGTPTYWDL